MNKITVTEKEMKNPQATIYALKMSRNQLKVNNRELKSKVDRLNKANMTIATLSLAQTELTKYWYPSTDEQIKKADEERNKYIKLYRELNSKYKWLKSKYNAQTGNLILTRDDDGLCDYKDPKTITIEPPTLEELNEIYKPVSCTKHFQEELDEKLKSAANKPTLPERFTDWLMGLVGK